MLSHIIKTGVTSRALLTSKTIIPVVQSLNTKRLLTTTNNGFLAQKQDDNSSKKQKSILTDDLLTKAGIDIDDPSLSTKKEPTGENAEGEEGEKDTSGNTGKKAKKIRKTSTEVKRERYSNWFYIFSFSALAGYGLYMTRDWEENEPQ